MKTIIIYATKYGATAEIAQRIAGRIDGAVVHDLKQSGIRDLAGFDCVVFGSSVYAGMIRREAKVFLSQNEETLRQKKLGLFLSGIGESGETAFFKNNFSPAVLQAARATAFLGGVFDPKKGNFVERLIIKIVTKQSGYQNTINDSRIGQFVEAMKA